TKILSNTNESEIDTIVQYIENDILLDNNEIKKVITKLSYKNMYIPKIAQAIAIYVQVVNDSIATEEILNDKKIIAIVQGEENEEEPTKQEIKNKDEIFDPPVTAAKVYNIMQTVICYEEQENSELTIILKKLRFLRNLLKKYKYIYAKSKKQLKIISFLIAKLQTFTIHLLIINSHDSSSHNLYNSFSYDLYLSDLYLQDYSQNSYFQDLQDPYSQNPYPQDLYFQNLYSQDIYS
ncbi:32644_t:CDS:1, partial [Racocetra persica]